MSHSIYYPILKWKKGEQEALRHWDTDKNFIPVIELVDEYDSTTFFKKLKDCYNGPVYFDTLRCDDDKRSLLLEFIDYCLKNGINAYPLIYVNDIYSGIINIVSKKVHKFAVKLPIPEDFEGPSNEDIINELNKYVKINTIDIFLDGGVVLNNREGNNIYSMYKAILKNPKMKDFHRVIICLTSFPENINDISSGEDCKFNRFDIKIFKQLFKTFPDQEIVSKLTYSDYGVTKFTETDLDFRLLRNGILPKVKYTTDDFYYVSKGKKNRELGVFTKSYKDIANEIIHEPFYYGKDFSFGDEAIYDKATNPASGVGSNWQWVEYEANHHIAVLIEQLSSLCGA